MSDATDYRWQTYTFDELGGHDLYRVLKLRQDVFIVEQACLYLDLDDLDQQASHMICWRGEDILAYQRCLPPGLSYAESSIGRIAVAQAGRGLQLGRSLVQNGIKFNLARWPASDIRIGAQAYLREFYTSLDFTTAGPEYVEDGIPHLQMLYQRRPSTPGAEK